jgi:hypothetical protein
MSLNTQLTNLWVNTQADQAGALLNGGIINVYTGTQPATGDTALSGNTLLVTLTFSNPAFGSAVAGVLTANAITSGTAVATGTATWFRALKSDTTTKVFDGTVATSSANLILPTVSITSGATVTCASFLFSVAKSTTGS